MVQQFRRYGSHCYFLRVLSFTVSLTVRSKTHRRLKEHFLTGRNRTKRANFRGSPLFQATYSINTGKQTINSTYLVSVGRGRLAGGKGTRLDRNYSVCPHNRAHDDWPPYQINGSCVQKILSLQNLADGQRGRQLDCKSIVILQKCRHLDIYSCTCTAFIS